MFDPALPHSGLRPSAWEGGKLGGDYVLSTRTGNVGMMALHDENLEYGHIYQRDCTSEELSGMVVGSH